MINLYPHEDVTYVLSHALCQRGIDAVSAYDLGHLGWKDAEHLEYAVSEARTLFTYNIRDFILGTS